MGHWHDQSVFCYDELLITLMIPTLVVGINAHPSGNHYVVLQELTGRKRLAVPATALEASAIELSLNRSVVARPQTHDLLCHMLEWLEVRISKVVIHKPDGDAFVARMALKTSAGLFELEAQAGDAIALALRSHTSIFVEDAILDEYGISALSDGPPMTREQIKAELRKQLERALADENYEDAARLRDTINAFDKPNS